MRLAHALLAALTVALSAQADGLDGGVAPVVYDRPPGAAPVAVHGGWFVERLNNAEALMVGAVLVSVLAGVAFWFAVGRLQK